MRTLIRFTIDMLRGCWIEKIVGITLCVAVALFLGIVGWGVFVAADSWGISDHGGSAEVVGREYRPPWVQAITHSTGSMTWTQCVYHPASWCLIMEVDGLRDDVTVDEKTFTVVPDGEKVLVKYRRGRMSDDLYITEAFTH